MCRPTFRPCGSCRPPHRQRPGVNLWWARRVPRLPQGFRAGDHENSSLHSGEGRGSARSALLTTTFFTRFPSFSQLSALYVPPSLAQQTFPLAFQRPRRLDCMEVPPSLSLCPTDMGDGGYPGSLLSHCFRRPMSRRSYEDCSTRNHSQQSFMTQEFNPALDCRQ